MYNKVQDVIDAFAKLTQVEIDQIAAAIDQLIPLAELAMETPAGTDQAEGTKPNTVYDFSCHCPEPVRLDRLPWYTSGFQ